MARREHTGPSRPAADTNADPNSIQIVVPGNDDAIRSIKLFCSKIAEACIEGSRMGKARAVSDVVEQEAPSAAVGSRRQPVGHGR